MPVVRSAGRTSAQRGPLRSWLPRAGRDGDAEKGQAHGPGSAGDRGRPSLVPGAGGAAGMGWEGGGMGRRGAGSVGGQGQGTADLGCRSRLRPHPPCAGFVVRCPCSRQDPAKGCVDGAAKRGWGACGAALEMGLVGLSAAGVAVRMQHCGHRQEHPPAQGTCMAVHLPCSAPGNRESKLCLNQWFRLKKVPQTLTAFFSPLSSERSAQH